MFTGPLALLQEARVRHGDLFTLDFGVTSMVALCHPRHAQQVLRDNARNYRKGGTLWTSLRTLLGNGLVVSEGDYWLRQRRLMQPHFHRQRLAGMTELMTRAIADELAGWDGDGEPHGGGQLFSRITMKVITRTMFASDIEPDELAEFLPLLTYLLDSVFVGMFTQALPRWLPVPGQRRYALALARLDALLRRVIARRRKSGAQAPDLLGMLLGLVDDETGEGMTDQQLIDEVVNIFLAGHETVASALGWAFTLLETHPAALQRLRAEVDEVLGGRRPEFADVPRLPYTRMVLQETLRLYPPVWFLPRTALADDEIDGYAIPAGTTVAPIVYSIHRHPGCWDRPDAFDPERFAGTVPGRHPLAWMPFGAGPRLCIGKEFALIEGQLILAMVLQAFTVAAAPGSRVTPDVSTTLRPQGNLLTLRRRHARA
jgi:cytochrome P450